MQSSLRLDCSAVACTWGSVLRGVSTLDAVLCARHYVLKNLLLTDLVHQVQESV